MAESALPWQLLADIVLSIHVGIVLFVVGGLVVIVVGNLRGWPWVNALWFRLLHVAAIAVVVGESWLGIECPLTTLERWLRLQTRAGGYSGSFIEHWLQRLLYWQAPAWVFTLAYSLFGSAVLASWWVYPPQRKSRRAK